MAGLSSTGFEIKRLPEIKADVETDLKALFPEISTAPDSVFGQIIGSISKPISDIWEVLDAIYLAMYPASAEGFSLDNVAQYIGVVRLAATKTQVLAILIGDELTVVPKGTLASITGTAEIFEQEEAVTITKASVLRCTIEITNVLDSTVYTVTIDGTPYDITSDADATAAEIVNALMVDINGSQSKVTASNVANELQILVDDLETRFSVDVDANMTLIEIATAAEYEAQNTGPVLSVAGTLVTIETPVSGLDAIDNLEDGVTGRNTETDSELRIRRRQSLRVLGAATFEAIRARILQEVDSVEAVTLIENRTNGVVGGLPAHSFEAIVAGGADQDIGEKIWEIKPAGIETHGTETVDVTDSQGDIQVMKFSRPTSKYAWVDVEIVLNPEETFPADGLDQIKANILAFGQTFEIGDDMVIQKFYTPVYVVPGVATATIQIGITPTPSGPPSWQTTNIAIGSNEIALFDSSRITASIT